jgi:hypothetical protein
LLITSTLDGTFGLSRLAEIDDDAIAALVRAIPLAIEMPHAPWSHDHGQNYSPCWKAPSYEAASFLCSSARALEIAPLPLTPLPPVLASAIASSTSANAEINRQSPFRIAIKSSQSKELHHSPANSPSPSSPAQNFSFSLRNSSKSHSFASSLSSPAVQT